MGFKINLDGIDLVAVPALLKAAAEHKLVIVDEIGPMEIYSQPFRQAVSGLIEDPAIPVIGTIVQRPHTFADQIKAHPRVTLQPVTIENRERLSQDVYSLLVESAGLDPSTL